MKGIEEYLILLTVCETCEYSGVDFLDFLRSGEKDIHAFAESRRGRRRRTQTSQPDGLPANTIMNALSAKPVTLENEENEVVLLIKARGCGR